MSDFIRKNVPLPSEIIEFFEWVNDAIQTEEDSAMMVSDDLLQAEGIYGGLVDPRKKLYEFTWYPQSASGERWEFQLLADEIDEIGSGYRKELRVKSYAK